MIQNNILLNKISIDGSKNTFIEFSPSLPNFPIFPLTLCLGSRGEFFWSSSIDSSPFENFRLKGTDIFYRNGKLGIGREPLYNYHFDIAVSENSLETSLHLGDGKFGFSMGNGTNNGFLPEILGMGKTEDDAGLYLVGRAGNTVESNIPLIILDARDAGNNEVINRPIFGITSADYRSYKFLIDQKGNVGIGKNPIIYKMEIDGKVSAIDFIIDGISILDTLEKYRQEMKKLSDRIEELTTKK